VCWWSEVDPIDVVERDGASRRCGGVGPLTIAMLMTEYGSIGRAPLRRMLERWVDGWYCYCERSFVATRWQAMDA